MARFFDPDSPAWRPFGWLGDLLLLSMMWFVCSIPLFTMGAATTALYDAAVRCFRYGEKDTFSRFLRTFKTEFATATFTTLLWGVVLALCYLVLSFYGSLSMTLTIAAIVILAVLLGFPCWAFATLSRFTFQLKGLASTTVKLAVSRIYITLVMGVSVMLSVWLCVKFVVPIFVLPCLVVLLWSLMIEPVFQTYM